MRKVINPTNKALLKTLGEEFIAPLLEVLAHARTQGCRVQTPQALKVVSATRQKVLVAAFAISLGKSNRKTFGARCNAAIKAADIADLAKLSGEYAAQVADLRAGRNPQVTVVVPKSIVALCKDIIYGKLFDHKDIWTALGLPPLTRTQFHENFRQDNGYPSTCPYCDLDTMNSEGSSVVEHLFPKSKFPLLSVDGYNLFSSCWACNGPAGKGNHTVAQLASPYDHEVGMLVDFKHDAAQMKLEIVAQSGRPDVDGYLQLLQLQIRYARPGVWNQFNSRREAIVESLQQRKFASLNELDAYVVKQQKGAVLTYAVAHWARAALRPAHVKRPRKGKP
ncbi:hypothetical protein [Massilia sp. Root335]|uniref:hypothetical protein n=1 Tax=Massilia sp. Root335 TaxID=1736517 RepID=UPI000A8B1A52|nr:hypothetical protein [Massilia sp. Root335]